MTIRPKRDINKAQAIRELWRRGTLDFKLHEKQKEIKHDLLTQKNKINVVLCARRFGKTYMLLNMALELCINKPRAIVKYICPQLNQGKQNIRENMVFLLDNCPLEMQPEWKENDKKYIFPNGSEIQVAGTDNGSHEKLRGGRADMCIVDEAGFCNELDYVIKSILRPTTLTTGGKIYLVSTPSKLYNHEFIQLYVLPFVNSRNIKKYTIYDNPMLTKEDIDELKLDYIDGEKHPAFKREYLCEIVNDSDAIVIPEFTKNKEKSVREWERPRFFDSYTSGDVGFKDLTVYLFAYWDFMKATLVIEDELVMNGPSMTTEALAINIRKKERDNFQDGAGEALPIYLRVMDNNLIMVNDLGRLHQLNFIPTAKDNKEAQINQVRMMFANGQIIVNPKCKHLIYHLETAMWDKNHKLFMRLPDAVDSSIQGGHADAVDALIYLVRNLVRSKNPYPDNWGIAMGDNIFQSQLPKLDGSGLKATVKRILNIKD